MAVIVLSKPDLIGIELRFPEVQAQLNIVSKWIKANEVPKMDFKVDRKAIGIKKTKNIFMEACRRLVKIAKVYDDMDADEIFEELDS